MCKLWQKCLLSILFVSGLVHIQYAHSSEIVSDQLAQALAEVAHEVGAEKQRALDELSSSFEGSSQSESCPNDIFSDLFGARLVQTIDISNMQYLPRNWWWSIALNEDGQTLTSGLDEGVVRIWQRSEQNDFFGQPIQIIPDVDSRGAEVFLSADGLKLMIYEPWTEHNSRWHRSNSRDKFEPLPTTQDVEDDTFCYFVGLNGDRQKLALSKGCRYPPSQWSQSYRFLHRGPLLRLVQDLDPEIDISRHPGFGVSGIFIDTLKRLPISSDERTLVSVNHKKIEVWRIQPLLSELTPNQRTFLLLLQSFRKHLITQTRARQISLPAISLAMMAQHLPKIRVSGDQNSLSLMDLEALFFSLDANIRAHVLAATPILESTVYRKLEQLGFRHTPEKIRFIRALRRFDISLPPKIDRPFSFHQIGEMTGEDPIFLSKAFDTFGEQLRHLFVETYHLAL